MFCLLYQLVRCWRAWDFPSLLLESIFLHHLHSLADALYMLAFQAGHDSNKNNRNSIVGNQQISSYMHLDTNSVGPSVSSSAPIFSARLYLALTQHKLSAIVHAAIPNGSVSQNTNITSVMSNLAISNNKYPSSTTSTSSSSSNSNSSSSLLSSAPVHRLWSEVFRNLHRDLSISPSHHHTHIPILTSTDHTQHTYCCYTGVNSNNNKLNNQGSNKAIYNKGYGDTSANQEIEIVIFSCGHSYNKKEFYGEILQGNTHNTASRTC